jgi:hypothetical protein
MKNFLQDIIIGVLIFVICLIIAIVTGANFLWLFLPLVIIVLLATLGNLLRQRYGSTYGITVYLFLFLVVPILWYLFCSQMPITAVTLKTQQKAEDFSSFKNYEGSIDAKKQFVDYQLKQDSITNQEVSKLLKENKVDEALQLIKDNKTKIEKLKKELLNTPNIESPEDIRKNTHESSDKNNSNENSETIIIPKNAVQGSRLTFKQNDLYTVLNINGSIQQKNLSGNYVDLIEGHTYKVTINKINSGPLFFYSESGGSVTIEKQ